MEQCMMEMEIETKNYLTKLGEEVNSAQMVTILNNQLTLYLVTREDIFNKEPNETSTFTFNNCYLLNTF
jgi:hypothetical protein